MFISLPCTSLLFTKPASENRFRESTSKYPAPASWQEIRRSVTDMCTFTGAAGRSATSAKPKFGALSCSVITPKQQQLLEAFDIPYKFDILNNLNDTSNTMGLSPLWAAQYLQHASTVALGDLHASYHKLLETLVVCNLVGMPPDTATKLAKLARSPKNFTGKQKDLLEIHNRLVALLPDIKWMDDNRKLILIGDVLSDRGPCDLLTLKIIEHLTKDGHDGRIIRLASNHDHNVVPWLAKEETQISSVQSISLKRAQMLAAYINQKDESKKEFTNLQRLYEDYLNQSKLMHYEPATKTLYTHAPITKDNLSKLIKVLRQTDASIPTLSKIKDAQTIGEFIEKANARYRRHVNEWIENKQNPDLELEDVLAGDDRKAFLWSRAAFDGLFDKKKLPLQRGENCRLVHGHDSHSKSSSYSTGSSSSYRIVNLDQDIRKGDQPLDPQESNPLYVEFLGTTQVQ